MTENWRPLHRVTALALVSEAIAGYPREVCGVVFRNMTFRKLRNVSESPNNSAAFDEAELLELFSTDFENILGVWHSHPMGTRAPSPEDLEFGYPMLRYWVVTRSDVFEWELRDGEAFPIDPGTGTRGAPQLAYPLLAGATQVRPPPGAGPEGGGG